ncbi:FtsW/RodA/SpoVE family cell cycle protein [Marinilactibacillus kalidii]|uniref:FtsW/RodA/SpoVE family cell cycle protein n=1 Tax=Marinilactibacillus kalidii TaxID=2820274 RepID=UPI001ABE3E66|nr:FtsW/RodA/SpoVE family cell cycle protein [Marinilactibacillus kalidii]
MERMKLVDKCLMIPFLILSLFSIVMVYSASSYTALRLHDNPAYYMNRQFVFVAIGLIAAFAGFLMPFRLLKSKKIILSAVIFMLLMLSVLLIFGREVYGAKRWLEIGSFNLQPAELAKLVTIWYFSYILSRKQHLITERFIHSIVAPCVLVGLLIVLIFIQPDTGSSLIILAIGSVMILASGVSVYLGITFGVFGLLLLTSVLGLIRTFGDQLFFLKDYQYKRFLAFWKPFELADGPGLQLVHSYYALSRGGIWGVGIGKSIQKTGYLPFAHTDFIVSIIGEEFGLIGILCLLSLFLMLVTSVYLIGIRTNDCFDALLCIGIGTMLLIQSMINLGGVVGLMPISGMTFPFISYGGSSMIILSFSIGLVANVSARSNKQRKLSRKER